ncbi:MAG: MBOAT family protein [Clostridia bacterium]|nr:MBOAT family protein [Clostridia bacterium]
MLFSSYAFLFWFLPLTLLFYFLPMAFGGRRALPWQNAVLLWASLFFYAWGEPIYVLLMMGVIVADTLLGLVIARSKHKKVLLWAAVSLHILLLFYYKYAANFASVFGFFIQQPHLPLGISFYTFQAISYLADVYRGHVQAERNPALLGVYIALFPQLIAGPIVPYTDVDHALRHRRHSLEGAAAGTGRFAAGLAKKLLLADAMGALFSTLAHGSQPTALGSWTALIAFALQIYFDFSGYSDMAIGLGRIFGFRFPENFHYPYMAKSMTDFWRRWHMTLSGFFKSYVYIPLGGNRRGVWRTVFNLFVVWSLTGIWHGATWNFLLWGVYYFALLTLEKLVLSRFSVHVPAFFKHTAALLGILIGWLIFALDSSTPALSLSALPQWLLQLLGANGFASKHELYEIGRHLPLLLVAGVGATPWPRRLYHRITHAGRGQWMRAALPLAALLLCIVDLSDAGFHPFLYFRF